MASEHSWVWQALEALVDLEAQRDEAQKETERLRGRIVEEYQRIAQSTGRETATIGETLKMIRAIGSPLDIDNPREPGPEAPKVDPLDIPPHLDRRAEAAERCGSFIPYGSDEGDPD